RRALGRSAPWSNRGYRVGPADLAEPCEVGVVRAHLKPVLDGERGKVRVADDVAPELVPGNQVSQNARMPRTLTRDPGDLGFQPIRDEACRLLRGQRMCGGSFMGADPDERDQRMPRETHPPWAVELVG